MPITIEAMTDSSTISTAAQITTPGGIWDAILGGCMVIFWYLLRKRDKKIDDHDTALTMHSAAIASTDAAHAAKLAALELKIAETYATKATMNLLFQESSRAHEQAIARVEKVMDETKLEIKDQGKKIDKVADSVTDMGKEIMKELVKKT